MDWIFEIEDITGRRIHLSKEQWSHINSDHPEISPYVEEMKDILRNPALVKTLNYDKKVRYFYRYYKNRDSPAKYLLLVVKYLNGKGFIITSYFVRTIP